MPIIAHRGAFAEAIGALPGPAPRGVIAALVLGVVLVVDGCSPEREPAPPERARAEGATPAATGLHFTEVGRQAGLTARTTSGKPNKTMILEAKGGGIGLLDYDGDGLLDVYLVNGSSFEGVPAGQVPIDHLYRNQGDGTFVDMTLAAGLGDTSWSMGCVAADYDNDGDEDLYLTNYGASRLYRNNGNGTFADVTAQAGVGHRAWSTGAAFADVDRDGDLDLYVATYLQFSPTAPGSGRQDFVVWRGQQVFLGPESYAPAEDVFYANQGDGTFRERTAAAGLRGPVAYRSFQPQFLDYDQDGDADLYVANDTDPNQLFENDGSGRFRDVSLATGASHSAAGQTQAGMGVAVGDFDNDADLDLYVTNFSDDYNTLYRNERGAGFTDATAQLGLVEPTIPFVGWGTAFADFDNDADLDLFVANGHVYQVVDHVDLGMSYAQRNLLFENRGRLVEVGDQAGPGMAVAKVSRGAAFGDLDNDGDVDIVVQNLDDTPSLLRNDTDGRGHWLLVSLRGTRSNRDGVGARVTVTVAGRQQCREVCAGTSFLSSSDLRLHFGLGAATAVDSLEVRWPGGGVQLLAGLAADQWVVVDEERGLAAR